jgi:hypothetical protein
MTWNSLFPRTFKPWEFHWTVQKLTYLTDVWLLLTIGIALLACFWAAFRAYQAIKLTGRYLASIEKLSTAKDFATEHSSWIQTPGLKEASEFHDLLLLVPAPFPFNLHLKNCTSFTTQNPNKIRNFRPSTFSPGGRQTDSAPPTLRAGPDHTPPQIISTQTIPDPPRLSRRGTASASEVFNSATLAHGLIGNRMLLAVPAILTGLGFSTAAPSSELGSPSRGLNVTFFDAATVDLKFSIPMTVDAGYAEGGVNDDQAQVTGVFQPDGRAGSPFSADLNSPSTATRTLAEFNNRAVDGPWTLSLVRIDSLETSTLESWIVEVTTTPCPNLEPYYPRCSSCAPEYMSASSAAITLRFVTAKSDEGGWNLVMKSERITATELHTSPFRPRLRCGRPLILIS